MLSRCHEGNEVEWAGYAAIVQVAFKQQEKGDPYHVAAATEWLGAILQDCFPERFPPLPPVGPNP